MIVVRASDEGFFNLSPLEAAIAPNVFLSTDVNADGTIVQRAGGEWLSLETLRYDDFGIEVTVATDGLPELKAGATTQVGIESVTFYRMNGDERLKIGSIELPDDFEVTAWCDSLGADRTLVWQAEFGDALAKAIGAEGFEFIGGKGDDIFAPHLDVFPIRGKVTIDGGAGNDHLTGTWGNDRIIGGTGDDTLYDERGHNVLLGGSGQDVIEVGYASDQSILKGGWGNDTLVSSLGSDRLFGNQGKDHLTGGAGSDRLSGGKGSDLLDAGTGDDILIGGKGNDVLTGGEGADLFVFRGDSGRDRITDFDAEEDQLHLVGTTGISGLRFKQIGDDLKIVHENGSIILEDFSYADLTEGMFLF